MESKTFVYLLLCIILSLDIVRCTNLAPFFTQDMNYHVIDENTPVGTDIYQLKGEDPEGSEVTFEIIGTDLLRVNPKSGVVTVVKPIDREVNDEIKLRVIIEDIVGEGSANNKVDIPIAVIVSDQNDNFPLFSGIPYETFVDEDVPVNSTVFQGIEATDIDLVGETLEVQCLESERFPESCRTFDVVTTQSGADDTRGFVVRGALILKKPLNYSSRAYHQVQVQVFDGLHSSKQTVRIKVIDVQNSPPIFFGSTTSIINEDDPINTLVTTVRARDGDKGNPRRVVYELISNPNDYFNLDVNTGEIRTQKPIDREALEVTTGVVKIKVKAMEVVNGIPSNEEKEIAVREIFITIRDVNDEPPRFNKLEYDVSIPENVPSGTPLSHLNMQVVDKDVGTSSVFNINLVDSSGFFSIEPRIATGSTSVSLKVATGPLDFENPNQRKFLLLVVASETATPEKLSSTATVTVSIDDLNDNSPVFERDSFVADVAETATANSEVATIRATDRDSGNFGTKGIRYKLFGNGADHFNIDETSGRISVAECPSPGTSPCLDFETRPQYFLSYSATDNDGEGQTAVVPLRITLADSNDNAPKFSPKLYQVNIDETETNFHPRFFVQAKDLDTTSTVRYSISEGNINDLFLVDFATGEITVTNKNEGIRLDNFPTNKITLTIEATDDKFTDTAEVEITVKDVNDRSPVFEKDLYLASVPENVPVGTLIEQVFSTDADHGPNAEITYRISKGAYDNFDIDPISGEIKVAGKLDYDRKNSYNIEVIAVDGGIPSLSGTTTLTVSVINRNDKLPYFFPSTQRTQITEDVAPGTIIFRLNATDPDVVRAEDLEFSIIEPITAIDRDGKPVTDDTRFKNFFSVDLKSGNVSTNLKIDRTIASIVTLTVKIADTSAVPVQEGFGHLVITVVDVNDFPPTFPYPWSPENPEIEIFIKEEQPIGAVVEKFFATDIDSSIGGFRLAPSTYDKDIIVTGLDSETPKSVEKVGREYFDVEEDTGNLLVSKRIDFETYEKLYFNVIVYDAGVPQMSATASVIANLENINDATPVFDQLFYNASVRENSERGTPIVRVHATDEDKGDFGRIKYSLIGNNLKDFNIGSEDGTITVINPELLDREVISDITLQVVATDMGEKDTRRSSTIPVYITVNDTNDHQPKFVNSEYMATIVENIPRKSPIVQVSAIDADQGINSNLKYRIVSGDEDGLFKLDPKGGILYPNSSFINPKKRNYELQIEVRDEDGEGTFPDQATIKISIENVNINKPIFVEPKTPNKTVLVPEESDLDTFKVMTVKAIDNDVGENGKISYHFLVNNQIVQETNDFKIDIDSGELVTKHILDREENSRFELILVARDNGSPVAFETLRFINIQVQDINDNIPKFPQHLSREKLVKFTVPENQGAGYSIGRVEAKDLDEGNAGKVFYYIIGGNEDGIFSVDKTHGNLYTKKELDREKRNLYNIFVKASNNPDYINRKEVNMELLSQKGYEDHSIIHVQINVLDENDNPPVFKMENFYVGVSFDAGIGEVILSNIAEDADEGGNKNLIYSMTSTNLFFQGSTTSAGSLIPSPFLMTPEGRLLTSGLMAEYNQDMFIIEVEARENEEPRRVGKAKVHVWVYEPEQQIKIIIEKRPGDVNEIKEAIIEELKNVTEKVVVIDEIRYHVSQTEGLKRDMTDMYVHVVDMESNQILLIDSVLRVVDANYDHLKSYYSDYGIKNIIPGKSTSAIESKDDFNPALAALIALLIVLFVGFITFLVVICCLRNWVITRKLSKNVDTIKKEGLIKNDISEDMATTGTENPLWIDTKYKIYEEQELTMVVFGDQDQNSSLQGSVQGGGVPGGNGKHLRRPSAAGSETQSNAYATINKIPMTSPNRRSLFNGALNIRGEGDVGNDYATLEKSTHSPPGPTVPGIHSTPISGSPLHNYPGDDRFSYYGAYDSSPSGRRGSQVVINKDGEPELVAELL